MVCVLKLLCADTHALCVVTSYMVDSVANRSGNMRVQTNRHSLQAFFREFDAQYASALCQSHLKVLLARKAQFVGTKTLNCALRFVATSLNKAKMRKLCQEHVQTILFELTLPLLLITQNEFQLWSENPVEYVRLQVDNSNAWNVKRMDEELIKTICNIRQTRRNKISDYLTNYLQLLVENLSAPPSEDFRHREALLHAFGLLSQHMAYSPEYQANAEMMIQQYVFPELESDNAFMKARACWIYGQFAHFSFSNEDHLRHALNSLYQCLLSNDLPVRVNAAVALVKLLDHPAAVEFIRPGLSDVIRIYLKLIDDIDYDELITSLKKIVDVFEDEIGPYALDLCSKLGEAFLRLHEQKRATAGSGQLDLDQETSLTAEGLMTAIRRILQSISGRYPDMYAQLEAVLERPIWTTLNDLFTESTDEGLTCLCELIYNQPAVSQSMWNFFQLIVQSIMEDRGILDTYLPCSFAFIINLMNKEPQSFKTISFPSQQAGQQPSTPLDMTLSLGQKSFEIAKEKGDEIWAMTVVTLFNSILENLQGVSQIIPGIIQL